MIAIFKNNIFINSLLLLPYAIIIHLASFTRDSLPNEDAGSLYSSLTGIFREEVVSDIVVILFYFISAVMINRLVIKNRMSKDITLLPGLFFILCTGVSVKFLSLSPFVLGNYLLIWALIELLSCYKRPKASATIFNVGFLIGIASIIEFSYVIFWIMGFMGMLILRSFKFKERLIYLIGLFVPFMFYSVYHFWVGDLGNVLLEDFLSRYSIPQVVSSWSRDYIVIVSVSALLLLLAIFSYSSQTSKKTIQAQKKIDILYWVLLLSIPGLFLLQDITVLYLLVIMIPLSILMSNIFLQIKNAMTQELIHLGVVGAILMHHFL